MASQIAVGQTVLNRALKNLKKKYGTSAYDVVHKPGHYEPWTTRKDELESLHLNHPKRYEQLSANAVSELAAGTFYCLETNRSKGQWTLTHANAASGDRTFTYVILG